MIFNVVAMLEKKQYAGKAFALLHNVKLADDNTFMNSLNVAMICYNIAKWTGFSKEEREIAALCGLLHDVGKLEVLGELVKKNGPLTQRERDEMEQHTIRG